ncbi:AflR-domain-containing protein [Viridothelium virens]|uniref:AflR-domain-containing protein n=1 Tax=Viridothelium virens TaxID=1048519 RepID=A0A6A6H5Q8_VIRVR|nr:AflR-domain-containing protein [Viridothelium virens]
MISLFAPKSTFPTVDDIMTDMAVLSQPSTPPATHASSLFSERRLDSSLSDPSCCCLRTALGFVQRLSPNAAAACIRSADRSTDDQTSRPLTIESIVNQNGEIIESIRSILQCPCSHDGYVLTTISLVVLKIISWYAAVARGSASPSAYNSIAEIGHADTVHQSQSWPTSTHSKRIVPFPVTVGGYCIDGGKDSHRMAAQLVLSELHRVQGLVNLFSQRLKHEGNETPVPESPFDARSSVTGDDLHSEIGKGTDSPLSPGMSDQLEDNLRRRLRAVRQELVDMLQRG